MQDEPNYEFTRLERIERKVDRIEAKLDVAVEARTSVSYLKWIMGATWLAIAGLFATGK